MKDFKYKKQIDELLNAGYQLPKLRTPQGIKAYRFASLANIENNHKPVCVQNPSRSLPDSVKMSGYALSCFDDEEKAEARYYALKRNFKHIVKTLGDSLFAGKIENEDGLITDVERESRHYDLYEYVGCDLNKTLNFKKKLS